MCVQVDGGNYTFSAGQIVSCTSLTEARTVSNSSALAIDVSHTPESEHEISKSCQVIELVVIDVETAVTMSFNREPT